MHVHVLPNHHANVISQKIYRMLEVVIPKKMSIADPALLHCKIEISIGMWIM